MKSLLFALVFIRISNSSLVGCPDASQGDCGRCSSVNDPHIGTFDGVNYDQHTVDCFQYVTECPDTPDTLKVPFEICGCHYDCDGVVGGAACIGDITISFFNSPLKTYNIEIEYLTPFVPAVNTIPSPASLVSGSSYTFDNGANHKFIYVHSANEHVFKINGGSPSFYGYIKYTPGYLEVFLEKQYFGQRNTCGLCGLFDSDPDNDFTGSDSVQYLHHSEIAWPTSPVVTNKINDFANTYLCQDWEQTRCYEIARVCCDQLWVDIVSTTEWINRIIRQADFYEDWMPGCMSDACALTDNQLTTKCVNGFQFARQIAEETASRTYK